MDKRAYRTQMVAPIPSSDCQSLGASSVAWVGGKEYPYAGEDAAYLLFRKRNCCETSAVQAAAAVP